ISLPCRKREWVRFAVVFALSKRSNPCRSLSRWFDLYSRFRVQQTGATHIPATTWFSVVAGIQFNFAQRAKLQLFRLLSVNTVH
ncbi:MAG: hypothetical protein JXR76_30260, partial [Deltaproteobacteria bacterium]|nr:hypothetical protein [Deltaproteobacteria bacterium]